MKTKNEENNRYLEVKAISEAICDKTLNENSENDQMIETWFAENRHAVSVIEKFANHETLNHMCHEYKETGEHKEEDVKQLIALLSHKQKRKNLNLRLFLKLTSAVAAITIVSFVLFHHKESIESEFENNITKPTLIVGSGTSLDLSAINENRVEVGKLNKNPVTDVVEYNTVVIPPKYTYTVLLQDSTEVFLNAGSRLKYPTHFNNEKREVQLIGEAYFKVSKSKIPFIVKTNDISVKVYGTEFNINTIKESGIETVLIEGSVGVSLNDGVNSQEIMMKPNQIVRLNIKTKSLHLENVNPDNYLAWRKNYITYDDELLCNVLTEIEAWYGLKFIYKNENSKNIKVWISVSRNRKVEEILSTIESMTELKFINEGGNTYAVE